MRAFDVKTSKAPRILGGALALALGLLSMMTQQAQAQSTRIDSGMVPQEKFGFYWETRLVPPAPPMSDFSTATAYEPGVIHRVLLDRKKKIYVGYDAVVTVLAEPNRYRVTFQKLTMTPQLSLNFLGDSISAWTEIQAPLGGGPPTWSQIRTPPAWESTTPREIRGGEVLELNLLENARTGQRVIDYITVQEPSRKFAGFDSISDRKFSFEPGTSRDFRTDDVELTIQAPRLSINGKLDATSSRRFDEVSGPVVWIYIARHGRYLLSLVPRPELGFQRAGEVRGTSLNFTIGNETFTVNAGARIAPGQAPFNLYVLHDPNWKPNYSNADPDAFNMGGADRAESLISK